MWVEWGNGAKEEIPKSCISEVEEEVHSSSRTRRNRDSRNAAATQKAAPKVKKEVNVKEEDTDDEGAESHRALGSRGAHKVKKEINVKDEDTDDEGMEEDKGDETEAREAGTTSRVNAPTPELTAPSNDENSVGEQNEPNHTTNNTIVPVRSPGWMRGQRVLKGTTFALTGMFPDMNDHRKERWYRKGSGAMEDMIKTHGGKIVKFIKTNHQGMFMFTFLFIDFLSVLPTHNFTPLRLCCGW